MQRLLAPQPVADLEYLASSLRSWGATDEQVNEKLAEVEFQEVEVQEENYHALRLYSDCQTQWRTNAMGERIGLDYGAVDVVIRRKGYTESPDLFRRLQAIEREALTIFRRKG